MPHDTNDTFDFYYSERYEKWLEEIHKFRKKDYLKCYYREHRYNWIRKKGIPNRELDDAVLVGSGTWADVGYNEPYKKL